MKILDFIDYCFELLLVEWPEITLLLFFGIGWLCAAAKIEPIKQPCHCTCRALEPEAQKSPKNSLKMEKEANP